jgi:hypothetical protein
LILLAISFGVPFSAFGMVGIVVGGQTGNKKEGTIEGHVTSMHMV